MTEELIQNLVLIHAITGGIALLCGMTAIITKKGSKPHVYSGRIFFWSMLASAILALVIAVQPGHTSPFLFVVGVFSTYLIVSGYRAVRYKKEQLNLTFDITLASLMIITGLLMIFYPIITIGKIHIILAVFGAIGTYLAIQDLWTFRNREKFRNSWLQAHLGKMMGGYIAATTAFVVVNNAFQIMLLNWLLPTAIGTTLIVIWTRKVNRS